MVAKSLILIGNPESGKSNYVAALWLALKSRKFILRASKTPDNIEYVEELVDHTHGGKFAPRTDREEGSDREFSISVTSEKNELNADLCIPDVSGEMWEKALKDLEISNKWMSQLQGSTGALLFLRALSPLNVQPLDWVTSSELLNNNDLELNLQKGQISTQVALIELIRFLEENLSAEKGEMPKVALMIAAWDNINVEDAKEGPEGYLNVQFPLLAGRLKDKSKLNIKVFGLSSFGGDLNDDDFSRLYKEGDSDRKGYVTTLDSDGLLQTVNDITSPIEWLLR
jgi:hypothetical protein